jgi:chaperone BCS1
LIPLAPLFHSLLGGGNQFASGGMLLMVVGAIGASLRKIPAKIGAAIEHQFTLHVTIPDEIGLHAYFLRWTHAKYPHKRLRTMALIRPGGDQDPTFGLAEGSHWFWYKGRPLVIRIEKADITKAVASLYDKPHRPETLTLRCLGRNKTYLENILREVFELQKADEDKGCGLQVMDGSSWTRTSGYLSRPLESVILPEGVRETLMTDIRVFIESKDWYATTGIPYHRGYLLYGLPGSGKSSLVEGFAHHFKRDVYLLHLSGARDADLPSLFSEVREGSILLLEDVDCVESTGKRGKEKDKNGEKSNVTLSGLLNVLDGLQAPSGVLYFLTTNHREKLDPALIRPGRVDVQVEFGHATAEQAQRLYKVFWPEADETTAAAFADAHPNKTMAELQMVLMEQRNVRLQLEAV